ncbi:MAG: polyphosphate:AMP phosphotransferase [Myxococcales bacterium]
MTRRRGDLREVLESAEIGHAIDKVTYKDALPELRAALLDRQAELKERAEVPLIVLVSGLDGAGKGETVNVLHQWLDTRLMATHAFGKPTDEERARPFLWRYWRVLPPKGSAALIFNSWYSTPLFNRVYDLSGPEPFDNALEAITRFERMLVREGAVLLKFWFHLSKKAQKKRLQKLERDPNTRWRVTNEDWDHFARYDGLRRCAEQMLRQTSTAEAPWIIVEGEDERYRNLATGKALLAAFEKGLAPKPPPEPHHESPPLFEPIDHLRIIDKLDLSQHLPKPEYEVELAQLQARLNKLVRAPKFFKKRALVAVFEGNDAAGKGGSIRRVTQALDARQYKVMQTAAPTEEERAQPYLWRFVRQIPGYGQITLFDRSWYGRVLVERVEALAAEPDWLRAYAEINDFETELVEHGTVVVKFWLSISKDEQLARFQAREQEDFKRYKITPDDYRNRAKWDAYRDAASDMVERTSTELAPWTLIEANDKYFARVKVLRTLVEALEAAK